MRHRAEGNRMDELSRGRPPNSTPESGGGAVRTPNPGESSSPGVSASDSPTLIDVPGKIGSHGSDSPTIVDLGNNTPWDAPTMIGTAPPVSGGAPPPTRSSPPMP